MSAPTTAAGTPATPGNGHLRGRRIVVTGAASGIGRCTAELFAQEGASLALVDRDADKLAGIATITGGYPVAVDITDETAVGVGILEAARTMGGIDGVVNEAGIILRGTVEDVSLSTWRQVLEVNLTGYYTVVRCCLPWMRREASGTVVNIASAQGLLPNAPGYTAYATSKGGVIALTRALAAELAPSIRVNSICPGMVDTPMADGVRANTSAYALGRLAEPIEIARAILFLTGTNSSYVTGAALAADGGRSFH